MATSKKPTGYVIYSGPSMLDGSPIVAIAITGGSSNVKTGDMVQTYILRADVAPLEALKTGADASICGDCKHRPILGGACYVNVGQGPRSVWAAFQRGNYPRAVWDYEIEPMGDGRMVRLGTYGDPAAVPAYVWQALVRSARGHTGYTHQWDNPALPRAHREAIGALCMASADTPAEATLAQSQGLRTFRIRLESEPIRPREIVCPASAEAGKRRTCATCGACNGAAKASAASVAIVAHGSKASRYIRIRAEA